MIKIHNLEKSFGNNHVLNGVNIEITKGECVCVIGTFRFRKIYIFEVY